MLTKENLETSIRQSAAAHGPLMVAFVDNMLKEVASGRWEIQLLDGFNGAYIHDSKTIYLGREATGLSIADLFAHEVFHSFRNDVFNAEINSAWSESDSEGFLHAALRNEAYAVVMSALLQNDFDGNGYLSKSNFYDAMRLVDASWVADYGDLPYLKVESQDYVSRMIEAVSPRINYENALRAIEADWYKQRENANLPRKELGWFVGQPSTSSRFGWVTVYQSVKPTAPSGGGTGGGGSGGGSNQPDPGSNPSDPDPDPGWYPEPEPDPEPEPEPEPDPEPEPGGPRDPWDEDDGFQSQGLRSLQEGSTHLNVPKDAPQALTAASLLLQSMSAFEQPQAGLVQPDRRAERSEFVLTTASIS